MADISFYKYLEAAFRYKLFNPAGQRAIFDTHYNYLGYNLTYKKIFFYARKVLPKFYTSEFPDTEEGNLEMAKKVLEKLDKHQDTQLENQFKAITVSEENAQIIAEAQAQSQQTEAQQIPPAVTSAGTSFGVPGLPSAPSISSGPRRVYNIPQAPDKPFQGPGQGTAATNKMRGIQEKAEIERVGAATAKANRLTAQTTTGNLNPSTVSGSSSPPPPRFNWRSFKMPASFTNAAKNFGSATQRFIGTNLGRIGRGLTDIARGVGRGIAGPGLTGTYNLLGKAANGGLNAFERLSNPGLRGASRSFVSSGSKKMAWGLVGALVFFVIGAGLLGGLTGGGTTPGTDNVGIGTTAAVTGITSPITGGGAPTICSGTPVSFNIPKRFLPLPTESTTCSLTLTGTCGRPGTCVSSPTRIVLHTTGGTLDAEGTYRYFARGSGNRGVGAHFIIGKDGQVLQLVETLDRKVEVAYAVAGYSDHISLEIVQEDVYESKAEAPSAQYQTVLKLVKDLMAQYNIPVGNLEYDWKSFSDAPTSQATPGVYGHYQLNPQTRKDPGSGFLRDIRQDLK